MAASRTPAKPCPQRAQDALHDALLRYALLQHRSQVAQPQAYLRRVGHSTLADLQRRDQHYVFEAAPDEQRLPTAPDTANLAPLHQRLAQASRHAAADIDTLLARLGMAELGMRYLDELSGGQKQLVGLAQALIRQPDVLLLDEPLSALDLNHQCHVMQLVAEETRRRRMVTLVVLHDLNIALHHCHRALLLKDGAVLACGQPATVITPATLASVYGVQSRVEACSRGRLNVLIDGVIA